MGAGSSTTTPRHLVAIGGLTGITHGTTRHVTWTFYHPTGFNSVHLEHEGVTGRRSMTCNEKPIDRQKYNLNLLDSSTEHYFWLETCQMVTENEHKAILRAEVKRETDCARSKKSIEITPLQIDPNPNNHTLLCIRVTEEKMRFVYTITINGLSYRYYQATFWDRAMMWKIPATVAKRKTSRGLEEGVKDHEHSIVVIPQSNNKIIIVDGETIPSECSFSEGSSNGTQHDFTIENHNMTLYITPNSTTPQTKPLPAHIGLLDTSNNALLQFNYTLTMDGQTVERLTKPPLLPQKWRLVAESSAPEAATATPTISDKTSSEEKTEEIVIPATDLAPII